MTGKNAENLMEIRAYIKASSLLGFKIIDIHNRVCLLVGRSKFMAGQKNLKDAARSGRHPNTTTKSDIKKITDALNQDA